MPKTARDIAKEIISREGGYVNDPDDPGGATNHGVTIHTLRRLGLDLTGDGQVDSRDVRRLTAAQAEDIFLNQYFTAPRLNLLPKALQPSVFDMQVNAGSRAVRLLQELLVKMGFVVEVDEKMGPHTARAAQEAVAVDADLVVDAYGIARRNFYFDLADRRPASRKFARSRSGGKGGWIKRAEAFMSNRFHLDSAGFARRVAHWEV